MTDRNSKFPTSAAIIVTWDGVLMTSIISESSRVRNFSQMRRISLSIGESRIPECLINITLIEYKVKLVELNQRSMQNK